MPTTIAPTGIPDADRALGFDADTWDHAEFVAKGNLTLAARMPSAVLAPPAARHALPPGPPLALERLRLKDPLGQYPQLFASIDVDALDLAQLTSTFSFGMITGRLSGRVEGLETFNWLPVALDARFFTTPGDETPHRISQRAVANLSSIGGGSSGSVAGALQSGFLRFFEQFHYRRLGLSCRLRNDICEMDGVAPAGTGYYIVQGSGLPRIDVIGSQRRVAWSRLVRQLRAISTSGGPVVR
jgi:hypothetical protein